MRKLFACALIFVMCLGSLAACGNEQTADPTPTTAPTTAPTQAPVEDTVSDLVNAKNYLYTMYKDQTEATPVDYTVVGVVNIGGVLFPIEWTVDNASVKIVPGDNKMVTIDVDDKNPEEVTYVLTATLKDDKGNTESCSFKHRVPAAIILDEGMSYADIVDAAYTLEDGLAMEGTFRLYGTITKVDTPWSADYKNITVTITVAGKEDKPIMCYRLKGEGAENLKVGDAITVEGTFKNYKGTIEFDAGCVLVGYGEHKDYTALLDAAYTLEDGLAMQEPCTMSGVITKIDTPWSADYKNITVTMVVNGVEDKPIMCYRLQGEGADALAIGDYITVTGTIKNYKGTIEFDAKCNLDNVVKAAGSVTEEPVDPTPATDLVINFADLADGGYGYSATINGDAVDVTIASQYQEIQYILPEVVDLAAYTTLIVDVTSNAQLDIKLVDPNAETNEYSQKAPFLDNYTAEGQAITEPVIIDLTTYADKDLSQINFMAMGNDVVFTIKNITFTNEAVEAGPVITAADLFDAAKVLEAATNMADDATFAAVLKGTVAEINTAYSEQYGNITITINVDGTDKTFYCFRLKGEGAATLAVGDAVAVVGTISKYKGAPQFGAGCLLVPVDAFESVQAAVAAYALAVGEVLENKTITGVVTEVNTAYSEQYGNVTVTIVAAGQDAYKIECFRMKGDVASTVAVGDTITVTGNLKNYNGKIEFDAGCIGSAVAGTEAPASDNLVITFANLTAGGYGYNATVNGDAVDVTIASQYQEIQYILPEAVDLAAYTTLIVDVTSNAQLDIKLVDPNAEVNQYSQKAPFLDNYTAEGQAITEPVYIDLAAYADKDLAQINFMAMGADTAFTIKSITFVKETAETPAEPTEEPTPAVDYSAMTPAGLLDAAYALAEGEAFTAPCTLTGVITEVNSEYSEKYGNITVTIVVEGNADKKIECFRLVGDGVATLAVGDTITVTGTMKNYSGKIEFDAKCTLDAVVKAEGGDAPATTGEGIDLSAGLTAGVDYNGIVVMDDMKVLDDSAYEIEGVAYPFCVQGSVNPKPKNGEIPTEGAAVKVTPAADGTFKVVFKLGNGKSYHMIDDAMTVIDTYLNETGASEYLVREYKVEAGKTYYFYGNGTKLPIYFLNLN